jgi:hypothetical protein
MEIGRATNQKNSERDSETSLCTAANELIGDGRVDCVDKRTTTTTTTTTKRGSTQKAHNNTSLSERWLAVGIGRNVGPPKKLNQRRNDDDDHDEDTKRQ